MATPALVIAVALGFVTLVLLTKVFLPSKRLPPGPRPIPIIGNFLLMKRFGSLHELANELGPTYGPIITIWMGSVPAIIVSGPEIIHESMIKQGNLFMGRTNFASMAIVSNNFRGLIGMGERHRFLRKLAVSDMFSTSRVARFRSIRDQEVDVLVESLKKKGAENGGVIRDFRSKIRLAVLNVLIGICFGGKLTPEQCEELNTAMVQRAKLFLGKPRDFIPLLRWLPDKKGEELQLRLMEKVERLFKPMVEERRRVLSSGRAPDDGKFVDTLIAMQSGEQAIEVTDTDILVICLEVVSAGTETTSLNLEYSVANLINHPEVQDKLFKEISAVAVDKTVDEDDIPRLPYLQAVVKESLRRHSPARLAPPRVTTSPTKLAGYDIPAKAMVIMHLEAVAMCSQVWDHPMEFKPERFLNRSVDITGSTDISLVPFGVGRRICPAINIALLHAHLILARLVQAFEWTSPVPDQLWDLSPAPGMSGPMLNPLTPILRIRGP